MLNSLFKYGLSLLASFGIFSFFSEIVIKNDYQIIAGTIATWFVLGVTYYMGVQTGESKKSSDKQ